MLLCLSACGGYYVPDVDTGDAPKALYTGQDDLTFITSVTADRTETQSFTLYNGSDVSMQVTGHQDVDGPTPEAFVAGASMPPFLEIAAHGYADIPVTFLPEAESDEYEGMVIVRSLTDDVDPVLVRLFGTGLAPVMSVGLEGRPVAPLGCSDDTELVIGNAGSETLHIASWDTEDLGPFALLDELPTELGPQSQARIPVRFTPALAGPQAGELRVVSDDPKGSPEVKLDGTGVDPEIVTETFHYSSGGGASVLLLVEDAITGSWTAKLAAGIDDFLMALQQRGVEYRLASVSTDTGCPGAPAFADTSDSVGDVVDLLQSVLFDGKPGAYGESLLEVARMAVEQTGPGQCMEGFLRGGDPLHVVVFAETDDASPAGWEAQVEAIRAAVAGDVTISAVLPAATCGFPAVQDYEAAVGATGGAQLDVCAASWTGHFETLAAVTAAVEDGPTFYKLQRAPIAGTVEVLVDYGVWPDVAVEEATGVVSFTRPPEDGAEVRVTYVPADICR